jgi:Kef-type K+ transport system membrane component KefB
MALARTTFTRLPLSASILYLLVGVAIGPIGLAMIEIDGLQSDGIIERLAEIAVIVSLFTAGLKLRVDW